MKNENQAQSKHTPGPWRIQSSPDNPFHYYVVDSPTESYLIAGPFLKSNKMKPDPRDEQREADAALIASAPDLLRQRDELREALKYLVSQVEAWAMSRNEPMPDGTSQAREIINANNL